MASTAGYNRPYTKLTCSSPTTGARGRPRFHAGDEVLPYTKARDSSFARKLEEAQVVPLLSFPHLLLLQPIVATGEGPTTSLQSASTDDNGTPATWTLISFQRVIDRQDRTTD